MSPNNASVSPINTVWQCRYSSEVFLPMLSWARRAASSDVTRFHLHGVAFGREAIVATDGHRMHVDSGASDGPDMIVIPLSALDALNAFCKPLGYVEVALTVRGRIVTMRAEAGKSTYMEWSYESPDFVPWSAVVPKTQKTWVHYTPPILRKAIRTFAAKSDDGTSVIGLKGGSVCAPDDPEASVWLCADYLTDSIVGADKRATVTLGSSGEFDPLTVRYDARQAVIMPRRGF